MGRQPHGHRLLRDLALCKKVGRLQGVPRAWTTSTRPTGTIRPRRPNVDNRPRSKSLKFNGLQFADRNCPRTDGAEDRGCPTNVSAFRKRHLRRFGEAPAPSGRGQFTCPRTASFVISPLCNGFVLPESFRFSTVCPLTVVDKTSLFPSRRRALDFQNKKCYNL